METGSAVYWTNAAMLGPQAQTLCRQFYSWIGGTNEPTARHDFDHIDLNPGNVLTEDGRISAIIDLENLGVGDRAVDVARHAFEWFWQDQRGVPGLALEGLHRIVHYGRSCNGESGWRYAITYEIIS